MFLLVIYRLLFLFDFCFQLLLYLFDINFIFIILIFQKAQYVRVPNNSMSKYITLRFF